MLKEVKVLLACSTGMSTSLVERSLKDYAANKGIKIEVIAVGTGEARQIYERFDVILLGPQVGYELETFKKLGKPVETINRLDYAMARAPQIFAQIEKLYQQK